MVTNILLHIWLRQSVASIVVYSSFDVPNMFAYTLVITEHNFFANHVRLSNKESGTRDIPRFRGSCDEEGGRQSHGLE
jgi:hypothetical protein